MVVLGDNHKNVTVHKKEPKRPFNKLIGFLPYSTGKRVYMMFPKPMYNWEQRVVNSHEHYFTPQSVSDWCVTSFSKGVYWFNISTFLQWRFYFEEHYCYILIDK